MKTLTLTQPFATLISIGVKKIETRSWSTSYRGPLAVHAAKGFPKWAKDLIRGDAMFQEPLQEALDADGSPSQIIAMLPLGAVVAACRLVNCLYIGDPGVIYPNPKAVLYPPGGREEDFGDYTPGRYAWILEDIIPLPEPIPLRVL
jgi:hypothetical protein